VASALSSGFWALFTTSRCDDGQLLQLGQLQIIKDR